MEKMNFQKRSLWIFTLLELLIVIAIIMILASLLLPSLKKCKEKGKEIVCTSNLKQVGCSLILYAQDLNGWLPCPRSAVNQYWHQALTEGNYMTAPILDKTSAIVCPGYSPDGIYTSVLRTYGMRCPFNLTTNSINIFTAPVSSDYSSTWKKTASSCVIVADAAETASGVLKQCYNFQTHTALAVPKIHLRHSGKANSLFADGHVSGCDESSLNNYGITHYYDKYGISR